VYKLLNWSNGLGVLLGNLLIYIVYFIDIDYLNNYNIYDNFILIKNILILFKLWFLNYILILYNLLSNIINQLYICKSTIEVIMWALFLKPFYILFYFKTIFYKFDLYDLTFFDLTNILSIIQYKWIDLYLEYHNIVLIYMYLYLMNIIDWLELIITQLPLSSLSYYIYKLNIEIIAPFITLLSKLYLYFDEYIHLSLNLSNLFNYTILISYILIKIKFKIKIFIKLIIKTIINIIIITFIYNLNKIINYLLKLFTYNTNNKNIISNNTNNNNSNNLLLTNQFFSRLSTIIFNFISNYYKLKYLILGILCYFSILLFLFTYVWPFILPILNYIWLNFNLYLHLQFNIIKFNNLNFGLELEEVNLFILIFILLIFIWIIIRLNPFIIYMFSVLPLSLLNEDNNITPLLQEPTTGPLGSKGGEGLGIAIGGSESESNSESESTNNENKLWSDHKINFISITVQDQIKYISNMMESKGLQINQFLIDYFIGAILKNTTGNKMDVDNFLNTNLNTIMNDQRNLQLNQHSFVRYRPFLLNNSSTSYYSSVLPYTPDTAFDYELKEELEAMKEAQSTSEYGLNNNNDDLLKKSNKFIDK